MTPAPADPPTGPDAPPNAPGRTHPPLPTPATGHQTFQPQPTAYRRPGSDNEDLEITPEGPSWPAIPGYEIQREIARGGMGAVLAARDLAFDRAVAIKVLLPGLSGSGRAVSRFVREAHVSGRLQHPGIVPVHTYGTLPDGRPFLVMKLIRGRTLAELLQQRKAPSDDLAGLVQVFEQVCQAVGYAHAEGVVHRDLKPANVMVGAFGEVQVMDWGLAKEVGTGEAAEPDEGRPDPGDGGSVATASETRTQAGAILGTPAYMPPEQARGLAVDERSDVFALGGILCEILTGEPPHTGPSVRSVLRRAIDADPAQAFARLDRCGGDPELVALARWCLSPRQVDRPADGREVARAVTAYRTGVAERLRQAETARAAAVAKAAEQRQKRRAQLGLAAAVGLLVLGGAGFAWNRSWQAEQARLREARLIAEREAVEIRAGAEWKDQESQGRLREARLDGQRQAVEARAATERKYQQSQVRQGVASGLAQTESLRQRYRFREAAQAIDGAAQLASSGLTEDLIPVVEQARADLAFVTELDSIRMKRSAVTLEAGGRSHLDSASAALAYRTAFRARGLDLADGESVTLAARIRSSVVRAELLAALDDWGVFETDPALEARILAAARLADPDPWRDRFREPAVRRSSLRLWWLVREANPATLSPATVTALARLLDQHGLDPSRLLLAAEAAHPGDFLVAFELGQWYLDRNPVEAIGHYRAALALRPDNLAVHNNLGSVLVKKGDLDGAAREFRAALDLNPKHAPAHSNLGNVLDSRGDLDGAIREYLAALAIDPRHAKAHYNLGTVLSRKGDVDGAIREFQAVLAIDSRHLQTRNNLGLALARKGDVAGAIREFQTAIAIDPKAALAHHNLGLALAMQGNTDGAIREYQAALAIDPKSVDTHISLGNALSQKGDLAGAIREYRAALAIDPKNTLAHSNLGAVLANQGDLDGAVKCFEEAVRLAPNDTRFQQSLRKVRIQKAVRDARMAPPPREVNR